MKKVLSFLLAALMIFSVGTVAFAGSYQEEAANAGVLRRCTECDECTGLFGCNCCEECPGYLDADGVATNTALYEACAFGFYWDVDVYKLESDGSYARNEDGSYILLHKANPETAGKVRYYWKALCCEECTGKKGCRCNNQDYENPCGCMGCYFEPDHTEEKIQEGVEKGQEGFIKGIQSALSALREVMYDLFDKLFEFLRIDVILGKDRVPSEKV